MIKPKQKQILMIAAVVIAAIIALNYTNKGASTTPTAQGTIDPNDLKETADFDYSNPIIQELAKSIKSSSANNEEYVQKVIKYVVSNIMYSSKVTVDYCYEEKASTVLTNKYGDCVSMSRLVTALLRANGIPAKTMGGCLSFQIRCSPIFATSPYLESKTTPMEENDFKKRGYLHEWVEFMNPEEPEKGWRRIESTSGQIFSIDSCQQYINYAYDYDQYSRCVIQDNNFWDQCKPY